MYNITHQSNNSCSITSHDIFCTFWWLEASFELKIVWSLKLSLSLPDKRNLVLWVSYSRITPNNTDQPANNLARAGRVRCCHGNHTMRMRTFGHESPLTFLPWSIGVPSLFDVWPKGVGCDVVIRYFIGFGSNRLVVPSTLMNQPLS